MNSRTFGDSTGEEDEEDEEDEEEEEEDEAGTARAAQTSCSHTGCGSESPISAAKLTSSAVGPNKRT